MNCGARLHNCRPTSRYHVSEPTCELLHMPLRLVHQLSLILLIAVVLSVGLMGGIISWSLHKGFLDYLEARDAERLERFVGIAQATLAPDALSNGTFRPALLPTLLDQLSRVEGLPVPRSEPQASPPAAPVVISAPPAQPAEDRHEALRD
ncbi:MAG: hypothetical protein RIR70_231, partial [Pseudomonadota bacterium]